MFIRRTAAIACVSLVSTFAGGGAALAYTSDAGSATFATGCEKALNKQATKGVSAGGGPKEGIPGTTNCDHFYQEFSFIGKNRNR